MPSKKSSSRRASPLSGVFWLSLLAIGLLLAMGSYHAEDPSFSTFSSTWNAPQNVLGYFGSWSSDIFFQLFGYGAWLWPTLLIVSIGRWLLSKEWDSKIVGARGWIALGLMLAATSLFVDLLQPTGVVEAAETAKTTMAETVAPVATFPTQGLLGLALGAVSKPLFGAAGSYLVVLSLLWLFCMSWWESLPVHFARFALAALTKIQNRLPAGGVWIEKLSAWVNRIPLRRTEREVDEDDAEETEEHAPKSIVVAKQDDESDDDEIESAARTVSPVIRSAPDQEKGPRRTKASPTAASANTDWELPPLSLLENSKRKAKVLTPEQHRAVAQKITSALQSFEIEGEVTEVVPGPIITMYEFQPGRGVRVQKLVSAQTDLAMTLGVQSVRIVAPIPGKSVAGIEVPSHDKEDVLLRDVFEQTIDRAKSMKVPLVLGKDGAGRPVIEDLSRMPHLLVGGATSMGKSVLVNSILTGLLCRFTPSDLKLIIVDPKLVEFKAFEDIPHLMLPIVNDPNDASQSLRWAVSETRRRYILMQKYGAKNIEAYNQKIATVTVKEDEEDPERFPYIIIIIDELAELMLTGKKDVEQSIVRLSQLARAAGIHLIMSTQRPSADVVTGLIKSNCPSRVALRVASASDSRIILDCAGAEQLIGKGDMFFTNTGPMGLRRMQGSYVSDAEIERICEFWRSQGEPEYKDEILAPEDDDAKESASSTEGVDVLYKEVIEFAKEKGKISTSLIQRRFSIGYSRAARIMEQLEERGVVGEAAVAGKPRDVMI